MVWCGSAILPELLEGAGAFAQKNNGWHSWSSDLVVMASGETYERSHWILAGRLKWVIWKSHPLSVMLEVIYLLPCDVLQAWKGGIWSRWFSMKHSNLSHSSPLHLMLSKILYCKNCKLCLIHDSLVILDTCVSLRLLITTIESSSECTSRVFSPSPPFIQVK